MKVYSCTFRDHTGAVKHSTLTAPNRAEALFQIKSMGYVPVSLTEGTSKALNGKNLTFKKIQPLLVLGLVFVLAASWLYFVRFPRPVKNHDPAAMKEGVKSKTALTSNTSKKNLKQTPNTSSLQGPVIEKTKPKQKKHQTAQSIEQLYSVTEAIQVDMTQFEMKSTTEDLLSMLASSPLGEDPMPMPMFFGNDAEANEDAKAAMTNIIEITTKDLPQDELRKEAVAWTKVTLKDYMAQGGSAKEFLEKTYAFRKAVAELRNRDVEALAKLTKEKTPEQIQTILNEVNSSYKTDGILPITSQDLEGWED
jgi:hypothetical protein